MALATAALTLATQLGCGATQASPRTEARADPSAPIVVNEPTTAPTPAPRPACLAIPARAEERVARDPEALAPNWARLAHYQRCAPETPEHIAARQAFHVLDEAFSSTPINADVAQLRRLLLGALELPCFAVAQETGELPRAASTESLRRWWEEGGKQWLEQYLRPMPRTATDDASSSRFVVLPPAEARVLGPATLYEGHPLRRLLCSPTDATCDEEVRPFRRRLERTLGAQAEQARSSTERFGDSLENRMSQCEREARAQGSDRYLFWRRCIESLRVTAPQMPVVHARAPSTGWLVAQSHSHPDDQRSCERYCAYDLATGGAHCATSCGESATGERGAITVQRGNVELPFLRELGWVMVFANDIDRDAALGEMVRVPRGFSPEWSDNEASGLGMGGMGGGCSSITSLRWIEDGCVLFETLVAVSSGTNPIDAYLGDLYAVVDSAFVEGVPRAAASGLAAHEGDHDHAMQLRFIEALSRD
ncbi:MAG: hypothetical protein IPK60_03475 [Sandaracinaceae bacterium]|nr:hypothetical protein [Sandaracinaceae bacterium]